MNIIMDRELTLKYISSIMNPLRGLSYNEILILIYDYCIEKGKSKDLVDSFIKALDNLRIPISYKDNLIQYPLNYFMKKYNICTLSKDNNILLIY